MAKVNATFALDEYTLERLRRRAADRRMTQGAYITQALEFWFANGRVGARKPPQRVGLFKRSNVGAPTAYIVEEGAEAMQ